MTGVALTRIARIAALPAVVVALSSLLSCDDIEETPAASRPETVTLAEGDVAVAVVNGVPIGAARVAEVAKASGHEPREVVERLIEFELLAAEASRRRLADHRDVRHVAKQAMVQRYLEKEFESTHRPSDLPDALARRAYQQYEGHYVHPKLYKTAHIHVWAVEGEVPESKRREAQALAMKIRHEVEGVESLQKFLEIGRRFNGQNGFKVQASVVSGAVHEGSGHEKAYIDATLKLHAGEVGGPVQTSYGSHVIYVSETKEASNRSFEDARQEVVDGIHPLWIKQEFLNLTDRLRHRTEVSGYVGPRRRTEDQ